MLATCYLPVLHRSVYTAAYLFLSQQYDLVSLQFMNKVLYAKEGAKNIMDNMFYYFPWEVKLEIDGSNIEIPTGTKGSDG